MTGNIVGESFEKYVQEQITQRQTIHGSGLSSTSRTPNQLEYLNSNLSWVKMASSAKITDDKRLTEINLPSGGFKDMGLAKKAILFNGLNELKKPQRSGVTENSSKNSIWNSGNAYGLGGRDFGLQPMPGITSVEVSHLNNGSLRKATVNLKAFNKGQFEIIEVLYLRLGFTLMLEWGNSKYVDKNGDIESVGETLIEKEWFKDGGSTHLEMLKKIEKERKNYQGNYDGFFGRVSNFSWGFNPDGSYNIVIDLISLGDVIESLKINLPSISTSIPTQTDNNFEDKKEKYNKKNNVISDFLFKLITQSSLDKTKILLKNTNNKNKSFHIKNRIKKIKEEFGEPLFREQITSYQSEIRDYENIINGLKYRSKDLFGNTLASNLADINDATGISSQYFMRFGAFLDFIFEHVLPQITNGDNSFPILNLNNDPQTNIMYADKKQFSVDPRICLINNTYLSGEIQEWNYQRKKDQSGSFDLTENTVFDNINAVFDQYNNGLEAWSGKDGGTNVVFGRPMNVYLNFAFILKTLNSNTDSKGNLSLFKFLSALCDGINKSLGDVNNLQPIIDESTNTITILDQTTVPNKNEILNQKDKDVVLEIFGYNRSTFQSNFVKNYNFKTQIDPSLATTIAIGASANGKVVGEDATAFSQWNKGIQDRFIQTVTTPPPISEKELSTSKPELSTRESYEQWNKKIEKQEEEKRKFDKLNNFSQYLIDGFGNSFDPKANSVPLARRSPELDKLNVTRNKSQYFKLDNDFINRGYSVLKNNLDISIQERKEKNQPTSTIGFIPVTLSVELEGISGIKIFNKLVVNTSTLPYNYPETLEFIIKKVSHSLSNNKWVTKLETISIPKMDKKIKSDKTTDKTTDTETQTSNSQE